MINFNEIQVALFDFDDTLCIHKHIGVNRRTKKEWYEATFERDEDWYMDKTLCTYSPCLKYLLEKLNNSGTQCYGLTWSFSNGLYNARMKFVNHYYPNMLSDIFIVNSREAKVEFAKRLCETYGFSESNVLIVEDHPDTQMEFREAGMQALSMSEVCNHEEFMKSYVCDECLKVLAASHNARLKEHMKEHGVLVTDVVSSEPLSDIKENTVTEPLEVSNESQLIPTVVSDSVKVMECADTQGLEYTDNIKSNESEGRVKGWCAKAKELIVKGSSNEEIAKIFNVTMQDVANLRYRMKKQQEKKEVAKSQPKVEQEVVTTDSTVKRIDMGKLRALRNAGWNPFQISMEMHLDVEIVKEKLAEL
ncbi:MAG: hypothetical protein IJE43_02345 [Alphaproteobacteria bacterium]|nr:hypothetical protein [Alphaproteobacteria bacterium]